MDENENNNPQEGAEAQAKDNAGDEPKTDAFGQDQNPVTPPQEGDEDKGKEGKKFDAIPEDHPTIVALNKRITDLESDKTSMGGNLSGQRTVIEKLTAERDALLRGEKPDTGNQEEDDVLFKDIKRVKDLPKDEQDDMTDNEKRLFDENADIKEAQNKMYAEARKKEREAAAAQKQEGEKKVEDLQSTVKNVATELAKAASDGKENTALANEIIESTKQFNLEGLTEAQVKERVENAAKLLPTYKPPKEQPAKNGKPVKDNKTSEDDPFGSNKIIEEATSGTDGDYAL